jgi:hypothetical protein
MTSDIDSVASDPLAAVTTNAGVSTEGGRLPGYAEAILRAASSGVLPENTFVLESGIATNLNEFVLGWSAAYLLGDKTEALRQLELAHTAWVKARPV